MTRRLRGFLPVALALVTLGSVAACGSGSPPAAGAAPPVAVHTSSPSTVASAGQQALSQAIAATSALRSYAFTATQAVGRAPTTTLVGKAVRPSAVTYVLSTRGHQLQIVRLAKATYLRELPGRWARLAHPSAGVDPAASLLGLLRAISAPTATHGSGGIELIRGVIPASRTRAAGLPTGTGAVDVVVTVDHLRHVTAIRLRATVSRAGSAPLELGLSTRYAGFDAVSGVTSPV